MKNIGGEKVLNVRVPYDIYCDFDNFVRDNKLTKTEVVVDFLKDLTKKAKKGHSYKLKAKKVKSEMEELGIPSEIEQIRMSLRDLKKGHVRPAIELVNELKEMRKKEGISDDEKVEWFIDPEG